MIEQMFNIGDEVETNDLYKKIGELADGIIDGDLQRKKYLSGKVTDIQVKTITLPVPFTYGMMHIESFGQWTSVECPRNTHWITKTLVMVTLDDSNDPLDMLGQDLLQLRTEKMIEGD